MMTGAGNVREPAYMRLARLLEGMISARALKPGDRIPSVRHFSEQQRVSVPTALQAYATLETRGLIEARPKSGFYVRHRQAMSVPQPKGCRERPRVMGLAGVDPLEALMADLTDPGLVPLGAALPSAELLPGRVLTRALGVIGRRMGAASVQYDMCPGSEVLRQELARRSLEWGCALAADDFVVTVGATEAVSLALRATCVPGDTVLVESPTYFGFPRILRELRLNALPVAVDSGTGLDLEAVRRVIRRTKVAACLVMPNFHNPVGCLMPDDGKRELVAMLAERRIPLIEDDIYGDLQHDGVRPRCLKAFDGEGGVILCGSYSKTLAPGYRVGYVAPGRWLGAVTAHKRTSTLAGALLPTLAVADFLRNGGYDRYLRGIRQTYRRQVERMRDALVEAFPEGIRLSRPQGSFLLWCELPETVDSVELHRQARASGISLAPGPLFSADGRFRNFVRINCGHPWSPVVERSVGILGDLVRRLAG